MSAQGPELRSSTATVMHFLQSVVPFKIRQYQGKIGSESGGQAGKAVPPKKSSDILSTKSGIASSEHDGARVEPGGAARVRGGLPCGLRRAVPLEATDGKGVLASLHGPVEAPYHPSLG